MCIYVVIERTCASLGCDSQTVVQGLFDTKEKANKLIEKHKERYGSWSGKFKIEKHKLNKRGV